MTLALLLSTLGALAAQGRAADLWLRDDDAIHPTPALDRFLDLARRFAVPVTLAVIPQPSGVELAERLDAETAVNVAVHGWSHKNHAASSEKKCELGKNRPPPMAIAEMKAGFDRLSQFHGSRLVPMLVPPWNRIDAALIPALPSLGYRALSVFGSERPAPLPMLNSHVDVIDWHGTRGGRDPDLLFAELAARINAAGREGGASGILTHHLVHDDTVWRFLETLFAATAGHPGCRWRSSAALIDTLPSP